MARPLTASSFYTLKHCPHALFLDHHGDPNKRLDPSEYAKHLFEEGKRFEREFVANLKYVTPQYPAGDFVAGAEATRQLMQSGHPLIYQGVLKDDRFIGIPDLLVRRDGESAFGAWHYEPTDIKTSKKIQKDQELQVCFYAMLLEKLQGRRPDNATIVLSSGDEAPVDLAKKWTEFQKGLADAIRIVDGTTETQLAIFSGCDDCVWRQQCRAEADEIEDVSLVAGLRRNAKPGLVDLGIHTVSDLAKASTEAVVEVRGIGSNSADGLIRQAQAQANNSIIRFGKVDLPNCTAEMYYDIESEPSLDVQYLHGLLIVEAGSQPLYRSFVAEQPEDEECAFSQFVDFVSDVLCRYPRAPIFHYHNYERSNIAQLFNKYNNQSIYAEQLLDQFVDLHQVVKRAYALPVEGYGLKPISKWLGFEYRNPKSSAAQSMLWYRQWLDTGNRQFLDDSILYNEDDCLATKLIKDWVAAQAVDAAE